MKKAIALVIVWAVAIMMSLLAIGAIHLIGNQAFLVGHKARRMRAYYTAKAGVVHALERLRQGAAHAVINAEDQTLNGGLTADITVTAGSPYTGCDNVTVSVQY